MLSKLLNFSIGQQSPTTRHSPHTNTAPRSQSHNGTGANLEAAANTITATATTTTSSSRKTTPTSSLSILPEDTPAPRPDEFYDLELPIRSFSELLHGPGWQILMRSPKGLNPFQNHTNSIALMKKVLSRNTHQIVTVDGLFNRGKTHLIARLARQPLPSMGYTVRTEGLCYKLMTTNNLQSACLFLDAAGSRAPIPLSSSRAEKKLIDNFLRTMKIRLADHLLLVVNQLTVDDQDYIADVDSECGVLSSPLNPPPYSVVHNFANIGDLRELALCIYTDIVECFGGEYRWREAEGKNCPEWLDCRKVLHYVLAKEGTPAGEFINNRTYSLIRAFFTMRQTNKSSNLATLFTEHATAILPKYLNSAAPAIKWDSENMLITLSCTEETKLKVDVQVQSFHLYTVFRIQEAIYLHSEYTKVFYESSKPQEDNACMADWYEITVDFPNMEEISIQWLETTSNERFLRITGERKKRIVDSKGIEIVPLRYGRETYDIITLREVNLYVLQGIHPPKTGSLFTIGKKGCITLTEGVLWSYELGQIQVWVPSANPLLKHQDPLCEKMTLQQPQQPPEVPTPATTITSTTTTERPCEELPDIPHITTDTVIPPDTPNMYLQHFLAYLHHSGTLW
ncbi:hypothetical protein Pelo_11519 [Pelomyxa schiedti]|nr:hypothetical protein Pelo_11519 [Pelomyxa schiedti]